MIERDELDCKMDGKGLEGTGRTMKGQLQWSRRQREASTLLRTSGSDVPLLLVRNQVRMKL